MACYITFEAKIVCKTPAVVIVRVSTITVASENKKREKIWPNVKFIFLVAERVHVFRKIILILFHLKNKTR